MMEQSPGVVDPGVYHMTYQLAEVIGGRELEQEEGYMFLSLSSCLLLDYGM
jgi:hypothetical protein